MAGDGEVIPNGSMHWRVRHSAPPAVAQGVDPSAPATHPVLHVTLRFLSAGDAQTALNAAQVLPDPNNAQRWILKFDVPLDLAVTPAQANQPTPNIWAQLSYNW